MIPANADAAPAADAPTAPGWWREPAESLARGLASGADGLSDAAAAEARERWGPNRLAPRVRPGLARELLLRLRNPLVLLLAAAALVSAATRDAWSASLVLAALALSITLDFVQERRAGNALERLRNMVRVTTRVRRAGAEREIPVVDVVPGDVVRLAAGDLVPADGALLAARDLYVNQATLTGEPYPLEKRRGPTDEDRAAASAADAPGALLAGSHVLSGTATLLVCRTGTATQFGGMTELIAARARPSPLDEGTRRFGMMLMRLTVFLALFVLLVNAFAHRSLLESFMFAVALAVGLTPELLPMIVSVTLGRGALRLAGEDVVVKRPAAIYALGAMSVLATDKTGTLTEGRIELERHLDLAGAPSESVLLHAYVNSVFESGLRSPLDEAILRHRQLDVAGWRKVDEVPFDFERRRVSVLADAPDGRRLLIVKGAPEELLARCDAYETGGGAGTAPRDGARSAPRDGTASAPWDDAAHARAQALFESLGEDGMRVLAICWREVEPARAEALVGDEERLVFAGFAAFLDPPREDAREALEALAARGVEVKVVTGDNERVARYLCRTLGMEVTGVLLGREIAALDDDALAAAAAKTTLFCRVTPAQKTRVLGALRRAGEVVGYMGDGVNDAPALRAADVGVSVDGAVDVAKEAADVILLRHHLTVLLAGVVEGRRSYVNVMKYLRMATSSNFGNMFSMAGAALFLPFLPLLPVQVLLNNLLYDLSEIALPLDRVGEEETARPCRWDLGAIRRFMLAFGPLSSVFDFLTFGVLLWAFQAGPELFRTGWFIESVASQVLVIFAIRTRLPAWKSRAHPALVGAALAVVAAAVALPYLPEAGAFGFVAPPGSLIAAVAGLVAAYLLMVEIAKRWLMRAP